MIDAHNPQSIAQTYLGPEVPMGMTRICLPYSCGLAPSYVPTYLLEEALISPKSVRVVEELTQKKLVTPMLLRHLSSDLQNHLETRIQLFFYQLLLVYKTGLSFALYKQADLQIGAVPSKPTDESVYVGAHSGTIPTLRLTKTEFSNTSVSLAQNTSFNYGWNSTVYLPEVANQLDSSVDRMGQIPLRHIAFDLLNCVSAGTMCPKEGLRYFLMHLNHVINVIKKDHISEAKLVILNNYSDVTDIYIEHLDIDYPFMQRLCLRPLEEVIDERFYMSVQAEMHAQLQSELQALQPPAVVMPELAAHVDLRLLQAEVVSKMTDVITGTTQQYITLCSTAETVRAAAIRYFSALDQMTPSQRNVDLSRILNIKKAATIAHVGLSPEATFLYQAALDVIRAQKKEPNSMPTILLSVLCSVSREILARDPTQIQNAAAAQASLTRLIATNMQAKNMTSGQTTESYIALCSNSERVQQAARVVFNELLQLPELLQQKELETLSTVKKSKPFGLSSGALAYYGEVLKAIEPKTKHPRNIPTILSQVLLNANN